MFGSFWRSLVGKSAGGPGTAAETERRLWVRHDVELDAACLPAGQPHTEQFSARVRDISRGGINLIVSRELQPGELLSLELPHRDDQPGHCLLVCVVRVEPASQGEWALGCLFSEELEHDELEIFGALRQETPPSDQRIWQRFPCNLEATIQAISPEDANPVPAQVLNVSARGIGLLVKQPTTTGALINVALQGGAGKGQRTILACVVHITSHDEGVWALGCNFIRELEEEDLQALV